MIFSKYIQKQLAAFNVFGADAKRLLTANLNYTLALPFIIIFGTPFVISVTGGDNNLSIIYNCTFWQCYFYIHHYFYNLI